MKKKLVYRTTQRLGAEVVGGIAISFYIVDDLTVEALQDSLRIYLDREDYEYCEVLRLEADRRGIRLKAKKP